jgi:glycosyltransferase involved in cell wall biosynthesis
MNIIQKTICVVSQQIKNIQSGPGLHTNLLIDSLVREGFKVIALSHGNESHNQGSYVFIGKHIKPRIRNHAGWISFSYGIRNVIKEIEEKYQPNIIHFAEFRDGLLCKCNTPVISQLNDTYTVDLQSHTYYRKYYRDWISRWIYYNFSHYLEKQTVHKIDLPIANSLYTKSKFEINYPNISEITVIHKGIDTKKYVHLKLERQTQSKHSPRILFVGGNMQRKGLSVLLQSMPFILSQVKDCLLWIVGNDPMIPKFKKTTQKMGIDKQTIFLGHKNQGDLLNLYRDADLLVLPALIEAFGVVILEAMAAGLPVIASDCGGIPEIITNGENGYLVPPDDYKKLAEAIVKLIKDENLRNNFIQNGFETSEQFSAEKMLKATFDLYAKFIG